jgi:hypothetical protein
MDPNLFTALEITRNILGLFCQTFIGSKALVLAMVKGLRRISTKVGILLTSSLLSATHVSYAARIRTQTPAPSPNNLPSRTATAALRHPFPAQKC